MTTLLFLPRHLVQLVCTLLMLLGDAGRLLLFCLPPPTVLAAENLFLRKQLALYQECLVTPRRAADATRLALVWLGRRFDWRPALAIVEWATSTRWHRQGFRLFRRWKSRPGRPPLPAEFQVLSLRMAHDNSTWGEERIANELLLKLGRRVSPPTIRKYLPKRVDHISMPGALTWLRGQASRNRRPHCRCRCKPTGTGYHHMCASSSSQYSVAYIMSTGSKNGQHDAMNDISAHHNSCRGPRFPNVPARMKKEFVPW